MDQRSPRDGRVIEELGWYDPVETDPEKRMDLNAERIRYWLSVGAQPSETVQNLLKKVGITGEGGGQESAEAAPTASAETTEA